MASQQTHLTFGLIADVQYADTADGSNYSQTRKRYYRGALESLRRTISTWKKSPGYNLAFVLQLGDLIDGVNKHVNGEGGSAAALTTALAPFKELPCPTYHMIGNHDLYNMTRCQYYCTELNSSLLPSAESGGEGVLYYSVVVHPRLKLVVLDSYDVGVLGYGDNPHHPHYLQAVDLLEQKNPNCQKNSAAGLEGFARRFVAYNGGIGQQQLAWLKSQLSYADSIQQNVLICGHVQLNPVVKGRAGWGTCLAWNYSEVQKVIHSHSCVLGCIMGHDHGGSHSVDQAGVIHLVMKGVVERRPGSDASAIAVLRDRVLEIQGRGIGKPVVMPLRYSVGGETNRLTNNDCDQSGEKNRLTNNDCDQSDETNRVTNNDCDQSDEKNRLTNNDCDQSGEKNRLTNNDCDQSA